MRTVSRQWEPSGPGTGRGGAIPGWKELNPVTRAYAEDGFRRKVNKSTASATSGWGNAGSRFSGNATNPGPRELLG